MPMAPRRIIIAACVSALLVFFLGRWSISETENQDRDATPLQNITEELAHARVILSRIQSLLDSAQSGGLAPGSNPKPWLHAHEADSSSIATTASPPQYVAKAGEIQPHTRVGMCLDGFDEKLGVQLYPCHGTGGNQYWRWTKDNQIASIGLCLDATGLKAGDRMKLSKCSSTSQGQKFIYPFKGVWSPAGPLITASGLCVTPARDVNAQINDLTAQGRAKVPGNLLTDDTIVTVEKCNIASCRQLWIANAPWTNGSTPARAVRSRPRSSELAGPRLLCWVMTSPPNYATKARTVADTWGRHCNYFLFVSSTKLPFGNTLVVSLDEVESRDLLWKKSQQAWMHLYNTHLEKFDWFIRGDDDTFLLMDNMRAFLSTYLPTEPHFFGRQLISIDDNASFYSGGSGTVLSKGALRALGDAVTREQPGTVFSPVRTFADDVEIALSLQRIGIQTESSHDSEGRARFITLGLDFERVLTRARDKDHWLWKFDPHAGEGKKCCSKRWVGTHYVSPEEMRALEDRHVAGCEGAGLDPES